jgi:hypothetical protein
LQIPIQVNNLRAMKKQEEEFMTARQFAAAIKRPYTTVSVWLRKGLVPGVKVIELESARLYQIPETAVKTFIPPKRGRPKKEQTKKGSPKK